MQYVFELISNNNTNGYFWKLTLDKAPQPLPAQIQYPALEDSYHFSPPAPTNRSYSKDFYRVNMLRMFDLLILFMGMYVNPYETFFVRLMMSSRRISPIHL